MCAGKAHKKGEKEKKILPVACLHARSAWDLAVMTLSINQSINQSIQLVNWGGAAMLHASRIE